MKALLRLGQFSTMIDIPDRRPDIFIMAPTTRPSFTLNAQPWDMVPAAKKWRFSYRTQLEADIYLYDFMEES